MSNTKTTFERIHLVLSPCLPPKGQDIKFMSTSLGFLVLKIVHKIAWGASSKRRYWTYFGVKAIARSRMSVSALAPGLSIPLKVVSLVQNFACKSAWRAERKAIDMYTFYLERDCVRLYVLVHLGTGSIYLGGMSISATRFLVPKRLIQGSGIEPKTFFTAVRDLSRLSFSRLSTKRKLRRHHVLLESVGHIA